MATNENELLKHYLLIRWCCIKCGYFETGTVVYLHAAYCPECGMPAQQLDCCEGMTRRALPLPPTRPRPTIAPEDSKFQVSRTKGITGRVESEAKSRRRGGHKATGRPRKNRPVLQ